MWIDTFPYPFHAAHIDESGTLAPTGPALLGFQLRPDNVDAFQAWTGGTVLLINGGPAVLLPSGGVVGLGDFVLRPSAGGDLTAEPADGFFNRYLPDPINA